VRFIICGVLLLSACGRDLTAPRPALLVTASVSRTSFRAGDTVTVLVTVFNRSSQPQTIDGFPCVIFEVTAQDGSVVGPNGRFCSADLVLKTLAPGEQFSLSQSWNGAALGNGAGAPIVMLPSGTYLVVGTFGVYVPDPTSVPLPATDRVPAVVGITR